MKISLQIPSFTWPGGSAELAPRLKEIVQTADEGGFYSIWVMDHYFQLDPMLGPADQPMLEAYSALTYIAAVTSNVKLGALVTGVHYRYPGFLIKQVTNLDVLSGGRAYFGIGAGWYERESVGLGFPFPATKERFERLEETLQITQQMWSDDNGAYNGKHYQLAETLCNPQPVAEPRPPIMIGGMGEKKTLRLVAQYADATNLFAFAGTDVLRHKLEVLRGHCEAIGRNYDEIERSALGTVHVAADASSAADIVAQCAELADVGIQHAIFNMPNVHDITPLATFASEIIPEVTAF
ncbi:MAG: LLM class F420-dependent oxidoreductase [Anaerolineae bacterium]|nr:LLM class F420-dependent oxidoreductase [Anaerolineae bacterium]